MNMYLDALLTNTLLFKKQLNKQVVTKVFNNGSKKANFINNTNEEIRGKEKEMKS